MTAIQGLYVLIDPVACGLRGPVETCRLALEGGATVIQWRDKLRDKGQQLPDAAAILVLCRQAGVPLIVNDHADLALALAAGSGADGLGVHVGQKDLPVALLRAIVPGDFIVGASTNNVAEAEAAVAAGADYIAVGDLFGTGSKEGTRSASPGRLAEVKAAVSVPVAGIGGINLSNIAVVIESGADAVAVISAVCGAVDPREASRRLVTAIEAARRAA